MKFTIPLSPITKKNSSQIIQCHGRPIDIVCYVADHISFMAYRYKFMSFVCILSRFILIVIAPECPKFIMLGMPCRQE